MNTVFDLIAEHALLTAHPLFAARKFDIIILELFNLKTTDESVNTNDRYAL